MRCRYFQLELQSDAVITENAATAGGHRCLDYIPGACFLGACATMYEDFGEDAFTIFHSGGVRFGNAYPLDNERIPTFPVPLSWHFPKGESAHRESRLLPEFICNLAGGSWFDAERQPKQMRSGYASLAGGFVEPGTGFRLKTAIDRSRGGRAADGQLFGYASLQAGTRWAFRLDFDPAVPARVEEAIVARLTGPGIRVGRSRSAEYGMARIIEAAAWTSPAAQPTGRVILIHCLSDLALRDPATGMPTVTAAPGHFGLAGARPLPEWTFLRLRSYAPFNSKRGANDLERQVVAKGSVLAFEAAEMLTQEQLIRIQAQLAAGVGLYRQDGLGQVAVNPPYLTGGALAPAALAEPLPLVPEQNAEGDSALLSWLAGEARQVETEEKAAELAETWTDILAPQVRGLGGAAPGASQWSKLRHLALQSDTPAGLEAELFGKKGLCTHGVTREQWQKEFNHHGWVSFADFLQRCLEKTRYDQDLVLKALNLLGRNMAHRLNQQKERQRG